MTLPLITSATELHDPVGYAAWVTWAPLLLVGAVAGYYVWVWSWSRHTPPATEAYVAKVAEPKEKARAAALTSLDRIEAQVRNGRLDVRTGFQQLSATVRGFVEEVTEVPARAMTLTELQDVTDPRVGEAIAAMYPPEFEPGETDAAELDRSVAQARELVRRWT